MPELRLLGLRVKTGAPCGVAIYSGTHVRAIWHAGNCDFDFIPAGYSQPQIIVKTLAEVK